VKIGRSETDIERNAMTGSEEHDLATGAGVGGLLGAGGAVVRALRTPQTVRQFLASTLTGLFFSAIAAVLILWYYPKAPFEVAVAAAAFVGFVSANLAKMLIKLTDRLFARVSATLDSKMDAAGWKTSPPLPPKLDAKPEAGTGGVSTSSPAGSGDLPRA